MKSIDFDGVMKQLLPRRLTKEGDWIPLWQLREFLGDHHPKWDVFAGKEVCACRGWDDDKPGSWEKHVMEEIG